MVTSDQSEVGVSQFVAESVVLGMQMLATLNTSVISHLKEGQVRDGGICETVPLQKLLHYGDCVWAGQGEGQEAREKMVSCGDQTIHFLVVLITLWSFHSLFILPPRKIYWSPQ